MPADGHLNLMIMAVFLRILARNLAYSTRLSSLFRIILNKTVPPWSIFVFYLDSTSLVTST